jgi:Family of unknown function (DUF5309)
MALATSAFTTFSAVANREDLSDTIYRIDPADTPFYSNLERETAKATNHEWQVQSLASASTSNAQFEGDDNATPDAVIPTARLGNYTQIQVKIPRVTGTQQAVESAGRPDEMGYQIMLKGLELKRDVESNMLANQLKAVGSAGAARKYASVLAFIKTNTDKGGGSGADPTSADGSITRVDGTQRNFTEAQLKNVLQKIWTAGGKPDTLMLGAFNKQVFSTFTGRGTPTQDQADKKITAGVDIYQSDFGNLRAVPNRFMRTRDVLALQMDMWASAALSGRNFISFELAKTGDTERRELLVEHTLVARNEAASGGVFDLTSS